MIYVDLDWWQTLFDEVYLVTDAPIVGNPPLTKREVDVVGRAGMPWNWLAEDTTTSPCSTMPCFCCGGAARKHEPRIVFPGL
jgi:hypothetical protein